MWSLCCLTGHTERLTSCTRHGFIASNLIDLSRCLLIRDRFRELPCASGSSRTAAVYALTLKDESKEPPIAFAGAWVMTARDGSATVDASGITRLSDKTTAIEINAKAIAGEVVLYTPSGGLQGFASLQALEVELNRRHTQFTEFESLLELLSPTDLMRVRALAEKAATSLEFTFKEIHDSVFDYWFQVGLTLFVMHLEPIVEH